MKYVYTAIFTEKENKKGFYCKIPDLPGCITTGKDLSDAIEMITDAASLWLLSAEDHDDPIPTPTPQHKLEIPKDALSSMINIDTLQYRNELDSKAVRKNVSLPAWMANLAEKRGVNFSQVLQEGLMRIL